MFHIFPEFLHIWLQLKTNDFSGHWPLQKLTKKSVLCVIPLFLVKMYSKIFSDFYWKGVYFCTWSFIEVSPLGFWQPKTLPHWIVEVLLLFLSFLPIKHWNVSHLWQIANKVKRSVSNLLLTSGCNFYPVSMEMETRKIK